MPDPTYLSTPTVERLPTLLRQIAAGEYRIPRFQRPFIWKDEQRLLLLDSVKQGLPIGSILVWRTSSQKLKEHTWLGPFRLPESAASGVRSYVIDGHQRLVTLYSALSDPTIGDDPAQDQEEDEEDQSRDIRWPIYYDLENEAFVLARRRGKVKEEWLPLPTLRAPNTLYEYQKQLLARGAKQLAARAEALAEQFKDYSVPVVPLLTENLGVVTECFRRVNSKGTPMDQVDMLNAMSWTEHFDLRRRLRAVKDRLQAIGWGDVDPQVLVDALKVEKGLGYYSATPDEIFGSLQGDPEVLDRLPAHIERAAEFLGSRCTVRGPQSLPYPIQLVLLGEAARMLDGPIDGHAGDLLERWFWYTTFTESFTGRSNRDVQEAVDLVRAIASGAVHDLTIAPGSVVMPVERFRPNAVRGRALALMLARIGPLDDLGQPVDAADLLGERGAETIPKVFPTDELRRGMGEGPENRWIVPPRRLKAMRDVMHAGLNPQRDEILRSHLILEEAADRLLRGDLDGFLRLRRRDLIAMEREFVESIGLSYAESYLTVPQG